MLGNSCIFMYYLLMWGNSYYIVCGQKDLYIKLNILLCDKKEKIWKDEKGDLNYGTCFSFGLSEAQDFQSMNEGKGVKDDVEKGQQVGLIN